MKLIELETEGVVAVARLLEEAAPRSVQFFWDALPIEETLRHVRWSGSAAYVLASGLRDPSFPLENRVSFYHPATIAFKPLHGELALSYGEAQAREATGIGWATGLAVFEGDSAQFLHVLSRTQSEGRKQLTIRRKEN